MSSSYLLKDQNKNKQEQSTKLVEIEPLDLSSNQVWKNISFFIQNFFFKLKDETSRKGICDCLFKAGFLHGNCSFTF